MPPINRLALNAEFEKLRVIRSCGTTMTEHLCWSFQVQPIFIAVHKLPTRTLSCCHCAPQLAGRFRSYSIKYDGRPAVKGRKLI